MVAEHQADGAQTVVFVEELADDKLADHRPRHQA